MEQIHGRSLTDLRLSLRHPFRTPKLTGQQVGWFRPAAAIIIAMFLPTLLAGAIVFNGGPVFTGPPKDGNSYGLADHIGIVLACLSVSIVVSWMIAPVALLGLRAAAMLGWAGWGTAILSAVFLGLPLAHLALNGDLTTDEHAIPVHLTVAIACLGLSVWAAFWGLIALRQKRLRRRSDC